MSKANPIPAGTTAKEVLAMVVAKTATKAQAIAFLKARVQRDIEAGRRPKFASRKALEQLSGKAVEFDHEAAKTRRQRKQASSEAAAPKAATKPARKGTRKKAAVSADDLLKQIEGMDKDEVLAAFTTWAAK